MSDPEGTGEIRTTSSTGGQKGTKLARFSLLPAGPLRKIAEHFGIGASKYEDRNWERGYEWGKSYDALQRHLNAWWGGEDNDPELGSSHLAAAGFHVLALLEWLETHPEFDDRPTTIHRREAVGLAGTEEDFYSTFQSDENAVNSEALLVTNKFRTPGGPLPDGIEVLVRRPKFSVDAEPTYFPSKVEANRWTPDGWQYYVFDVAYLRERWVWREDLFVNP